MVYRYPNKVDAVKHGWNVRLQLCPTTDARRWQPHAGHTELFKRAPRQDKYVYRLELNQDTDALMAGQWYKIILY